MVRRKEHTPQALAKAKYLYEKTLAPVDDIAAMLGLSRTPFYKRVRAGGWKRRRASVATYAFARAMTQCMGDGAAEMDAPPASAEAPASVSARPAGTGREDARVALALRIQRVAEREMDAIERVLATLGPSAEVEADRCARTLAGIARTLREITALNTPEDITPKDEADADAIPVDLDELRCELARRINQVIEARYRDAHGGAGDGRGRAGPEEN